MPSCVKVLPAAGLEPYFTDGVCAEMGADSNKQAKTNDKAFESMADMIVAGRVNRARRM
jgi:hypothetical protein